MNLIPSQNAKSPLSFSRYVHIFGDIVFLLCILFVSLAIHPSLYHTYSAPKFLLLGMFSLFLFPVISLVMISGYKNRASHFFILGLLGWLLSNCISSLPARFPGIAFRQFAFFLACAVFAFWAFYRVQDGKLFTLTVGVLAFVSLCGALYGFAQFSELDFLDLEEVGIPVAFWGNPNFASHFLIAIIPLFLAMLAIRPRRIFFLVCFCMVLMQVFLLHSRGGIIGVTAGIVFFSWIMFTLFSKGKRPDGVRLVRFTPPIIIILVIGILVAGMTFLYLDQWRVAKEISSIFSLSGESNRFRLLSWKASLRLALNHILLGIGPGHYRLLFPSFAQPEFWKLLGTFSAILNVRAHNDYINILCETGLLGLGFFIMIIIYLFRGYRRLIRSETVSLKDKIYASGAASGLIATLTQSLVDFNLYNPASGLVFWVSCGFLAGFIASQKPRIEKISLRIPGLILLLFSLATLIFIPQRLLMHYRIERDLRIADILFSKGDFVKAGDFAGRILNRDPRNLDAVTLYADSLRNTRGKEKQAINAYQYWAEIEPWFVPIYNRMGECWFRLGNKAEAVRSFEKALSINPYSEPVILNLGNMALAERNFAMAANYFERAASLGGTLMRENEAQYGIALMQIKKYREVIPHLENGILAQPDKAPYLSELLGDCYLATGDRENAALYYKTALMFGTKESLKKKLSGLNNSN